MSEEKPLHVRVAEALGWTDIKEAAFLPVTVSNWLGKPPAWDHGPHMYVAAIDHVERKLTYGAGSIPRYDTDWSATGPLIEKYGICTFRDGLDEEPWAALHGEPDVSGHELYFHEEESGGGTTPLLAACNLILALKAAGKLP